MRMNLEIDIAASCRPIRVPTLVLHRSGGRAHAGRGRPLPGRAHPGRAVRRASRARTTSRPSATPTRRRRDRGVPDGVRAGDWEPAEPDRVLATVLFTDIVGSTERAAELGDRALARAARAPPRARPPRARALPRRARSTPPATASSPPSTARRARSAAPARSATPFATLGLELRAGLHTGECELIDDKVGGIAVHIGARVAAAGRRRRGARLEHGQGPRRRLGNRVRRPRRARPQRRPGRMECVRRMKR